MSISNTYSAFKDSGIEWAEDIPEHWQILPLRSIFHERKEKNIGPKTEFILSVMKDIGVIPYDEKGNVGNKKSENIENYKVVHPNDLVINKMNAIIGSLGISKYHGALSQVYIVLYPRNKQLAVNRFLAYLFGVKPFQKSLIKISTGMMELRESINFIEFKNLRLPIPPLNEQNKIADFLDQKTAFIDEAIAKKQRLIELLKEQKAILINRAVIRGLNPNVPMKESGVEWIGEIPAHWEFKKLSNISRVVRGASPRPAGDPRFFASEFGTPWVTVAEITKDSNLYLTDTKEYLTDAGVSASQFFPKGLVLFTNSGATLGVPKILSVGCCANDGVLAFKSLSKSVDSEYLYFYLSAQTTRLREEIKQGSGQPNLNTFIVKNIPFPIPPLPEQISIVNYLFKLITIQANSILSCEKQIQKLQEYKQALIAHAVTGKIKVS